MLKRLDNPALEATEKLLGEILTHILPDESNRVGFLCEPGTGKAVVQRIRVMISRKRARLEQRGKKLRRFRLHSTVHPETHEGKRFDCVVLHQSVSDVHLMTQELEDMLVNG